MNDGATKPQAPKTVVRLDVWYDPVMAERFAQEPDIRLLTHSLSLPAEEMRAAFREAHVYQISSAKDELPPHAFASEELLRQCPKLLCVSTNGAGCDTVDIPACTRAGVLVVNQAGANAQSVAEHTVGTMIDLSRRLTESDRLLRTRRGFTREEIMGREITGKTLGLVGVGHIGRRVARMAAAFDMAVLAYDPCLSPDEIAARGAQPVSLENLLRRSDVVSLHCPRTPDTMGMFGAQAFAQMKPGAIFITTARGGIHDEAALLDALSSGHLGGAGLDVWNVEPPPLDHPLLHLHNVVATYHTAGVTTEARRQMAAWAAEQVIGLLNGTRPERLVNPEAWPHYLRRLQANSGIDVRAKCGALA